MPASQQDIKVSTIIPENSNIAVMNLGIIITYNKYECLIGDGGNLVVDISLAPSKVPPTCGKFN
ncbi:unnamed protein product, partial [Ilex paraguariensis]